MSKRKYSAKTVITELESEIEAYLSSYREQDGKVRDRAALKTMACLDQAVAAVRAQDALRTDKSDLGLKSENDTLAEATQFGRYGIGDEWVFYRKQLLSFISLVVGSEREACAKLCESFGDGKEAHSLGFRSASWTCAYAIRARSQNANEGVTK